MVWGSIAGAAISGGLSYLGSRNANRSAESNARLNADLQREFAQNGIQWKVKDAKAAGIHPLYALGANTPTFSPTSVNFQNELSGFAKSGQNIGSAIDRTMNQKQRDEWALDNHMLNRERQLAEIALIKTRTAQLRNPPMPVLGVDPNDPTEVVGRENPARGRDPVTGNPNIAIGPGMTGEEAEQEWGEFGGSLYGLGKLGLDAHRTARRAVDRWYDRKFPPRRLKRPLPPSMRHPYNR